MTIRAKIWTLVILITIVALSLLSIGTWNILRNRFLALEKRYIERDLLRTRNTFARELAQVEVTLRDWAISDDSYAFIHGKSPDFAAHNLTPFSLANTGLSFVAFLSPSGKLYSGREIHAATQSVSPFSDELLRSCAHRYPILLQAGKARQEILGIAMLPNGPALIGAYPIEMSDHGGDDHGTLIMGMYLDAAKLKQLSQMTDLTLGIRPSTQSQTKKGVDLITPVNAEMITGEALFQDINGNQAFSLLFVQSRDIYQQGLHSISYVIAAILLIGFCLGCGTLVMLERTVLQRLSALDTNVQRIGNDGDPAARLPQPFRRRSDELDRLTTSVNGMLTALEDAQILAERTLRHSEALYRGIFESIQDIYFRTDLHGRLTLISPSVEAVMGYTPEKVLGYTIGEFEYRSSQSDRYVRYLKTHQSVQNYELMLRHQDDRKLTVVLNAHYLYDADGQPTSIEGTIHDITDRKHAEERERQLQQMREDEHLRNEFLAAVSHELKTPLTPIISGISLLRSGGAGPLDEKAREVLDILDRQAHRLLQLIEDTLDLFRLETGMLMMERTPVDLNMLISCRIDAYQPRFRAKGLSLQCLCEVLPCATVDQRLIEQVIDKLLDNALKYTEQGGVMVRAVREEETVRLEITDTGIGMATEHLESIFHPFFKIEKNLTGAGIGLTIVRHLVTAHGGRIHVESAPGKGSTFLVVLPLTESSAVPA